MSGFLGQVSGTIGQISGTIGAVSNLANSVGSLFGGFSAGGYAIPTGLGPWADGLQTASWRGIPFAVRSSQIRRGRRIAVHEYPFSDIVWVEDLGRGTRTITFSGFLIGDDVFQQRDAMAAASDEVAGAGYLVHPSLGAVQATLTEFSAGERADLGRVVEIEFCFIQSGQDQPVYPAMIVSTQAVVMTAASNSLLATAADFVNDVSSAVAMGVAVVQGAVGTVMGVVSAVVGTVQAAAMLAENVIALPSMIVGTILGGVAQVVGLAYDAAISIGAVAGLVGNFGRYSCSGLTSLLPPTATVSSQIDALATNRAAVVSAMGAALSTTINAPLTLPAAIQTAIAALQTSIPAPGDQIRLLSVLAGYQATVQPNTAPIGAAIATTQIAIASLVRRTACAALATASANYLPTSYQDALATMNNVTTLLDAEALVAADAGDTGTYLAMRSLRSAVAQDLLTRAAGLPSLITITTAVPMPSLALAYELYGDASRSDDLIARADPIAPLFMPTSFQALSS